VPLYCTVLYSKLLICMTKGSDCCSLLLSSVAHVDPRSQSFTRTRDNKVVHCFRIRPHVVYGISPGLLNQITASHHMYPLVEPKQRNRPAYPIHSCTCFIRITIRIQNSMDRLINASEYICRLASSDNWNKDLV
jgi:hypothetical protein